MEKSNSCEYRLKAKYNGLQGVNNGTITNKQAEDLIKNHPRGYDLFDRFPKEVEKDLDSLSEKHREKMIKEGKLRKSVSDIQAENEAKIQKEREELLKKKAKFFEDLDNLSEEDFDKKLKKHKIKDSGLSKAQVYEIIFNKEKS